MEVVCAMGLICAFAAIHIYWAGREVWGPPSQVLIRTLTGPGAAQDLGFPGLAKAREGHKGNLSSFALPTLQFWCSKNTSIKVYNP